MDLDLKDLPYYGYEWAFSDDDHDDPCFEGYVPPSGQEDYAIILKLVVLPSERRKGKGRAKLKEIINEIKRYDSELPIRLAARPLDYDISEDALVTFYESEGFEVEDDSGNVVIMVRYD